MYLLKRGTRDEQAFALLRTTRPPHPHLMPVVQPVHGRRCTCHSCTRGVRPNA